MPRPFPEMMRLAITILMLCFSFVPENSRADFVFQRIVDSTEATSFFSGSLNDSGQVAYYSVRSGTESIRVWNSTTGTDTVIRSFAYSGEARQLTVGPSINALGQVAYGVNPTSGFSATYVWNPATSQSVQRTSASNRINGISLNNAGTIAYHSGNTVYSQAVAGANFALYNTANENVVINNNNQILWKNGNAVFINSTRIDDPLFTVYSPAPQMNDAGVVVFTADNNGAAQPTSIYKDGINQAAQILVDGNNFTSLNAGRVYFNNGGSVSFLGVANGVRGLYLNSERVLQVGDALDGGVVQELGSGFLNNNNQLAFTVLFQDGRSGYFLATSAVPEPSSTVLAGLVLSAFLWRRRAARDLNCR